MKKFIITVIVVVFVAAGAAGWWYMFHRLDGLVEAELQRAASEAFGTPVTVGDVQINLIQGAVRIEDLAIGNPEGYTREHALSFGSIEAAVDIQKEEVTHVIFDGAQIHIEERDGVTNVQRLKQGLESRISSESRGTGGSAERLVVRRFLMTSTTATLSSDSLRRDTEVGIDEIEIRDLSGTPEEVAEIIANRIMEEIAREAGMAIIEAKAREKLRELLGGRDSE